MISVTVIDKSGVLADKAASTALQQLRFRRLYKVAQQMGVKLVMLVDNDNTVYLSQQWQSRIFQLKEPTVKLTLPL
ncbi:MAG: hypothetical protein R3E08_15120 [Thiotrichaceae bacterium]